MRRRTAAAEKTDARKKFGSFKKDDPKSIRNLKIEPNKELEGIFELYRDFVTIENTVEPGIRGRSTEKRLTVLGILLKRKKFSAQGIMGFSKSFLARYPDFSGHDGTFGSFITAMMQKSEDSDFLVWLPETNEEMIIGNENEKNVIIYDSIYSTVFPEMKKGKAEVFGNVRTVGKGMVSGEIIVHGRSFGWVGPDMEGGRIIVEEKAETVGCGMKGGEAIIYGDCGHEVGRCMSGGKVHIHGNVRHLGTDRTTGGEIHVDGDYITLGDIKGGKIYHKGKLIIDR